MKTPVVTLLSGGMDSTSLLALAVRDAAPILAVSVNYGQRHVKELESAKRVADYYQVKQTVLDLSDWGSLLSGSSLTDNSVQVPDGPYESESMKSTFVPNRNATLLMAAAGIAGAIGANEVWTAVHAGDHDIYPDCRPEFVDSAATTAELGTGGTVTIRAPFVNSSKTHVARIGAQLNAPLSLSWSCYKGGDLQCGTCSTCVERQEAFHEAKIQDPTQYREPRE